MTKDGRGGAGGYSEGVFYTVNSLTQELTTVQICTRGCLWGEGGVSICLKLSTMLSNYSSPH